MEKTVIEELKARGFIEDVTGNEALEHLKQPRSVYCGFDPTAESLHLGNLIAIMGLAWFGRYGHRPVAIVGGATGMIGDPSGKSHERSLLDEKSIQKNLVGIQENIERVFGHSGLQKTELQVLNNYDWFKEFSFVQFLRDIGKSFRMGQMLAKESVRSRLNSDEGMSFTEFSYQLLQGYDFLHLNDHHDVTVEIGGSDQWGNILAGTELVRKLRNADVFGLTFPLLTTKDGKKFGKSEKGAIWLSPALCSPYDFYQHLIRTDDEDVCRFMKMLTFMELEEIEDYERGIQEGSQPNVAQKKLAEEVTKLVHGQDGLEKALKATQVAKPGSEAILDAETLEAASQDFPSVVIAKSDCLNHPIVDVLVHVGMQPSKGASRRLIRGGGVYLNNAKVTDENALLEEKDLIDGRLLLLATGKKNKTLVQLK